MLRYTGFMAVAAIAVAAASGWPPSPVSAQALMSSEAARGAIERDFGVEVLRIEEAEIDGRPAFLLRVMNPEGDFNEAFQVNTLAVDRATGELIPTFRNGPSGYAPEGSVGRSGSDDVGPALRRGSLR